MSERLVPGEIRAAKGKHRLYDGRETQTLVVTNDGDRPIQVGSHFHFAEANAALNFDREAARGYRLAVEAGKAVRFEPGASRTVELVEIGGARRIPGLQIKERSDD